MRAAQVAVFCAAFGEAFQAPFSLGAGQCTRLQGVTTGRRTSLQLRSATAFNMMAGTKEDKRQAEAAKTLHDQLKKEAKLKAPAQAPKFNELADSPSQAVRVSSAFSKDQASPGERPG